MFSLHLLNERLESRPMPSKTTNPSETEHRRNVARVILDHAAANGISLNELAIKAGAANSAIYNLVDCKTTMGPRLARKLIAAGVNGNNLRLAAGFAADDDKIDAAVLLLSKRIIRLPPERRRVIEDVLDGLSGNLKKRRIS